MAIVHSAALRKWARRSDAHEEQAVAAAPPVEDAELQARLDRELEDLD